MPKYDVQKDVSWAEIASIIFKALEKEQNVASNPESKPEQKYYKPYERMKNCVDCCKYLLRDMQIENILDQYELRQDART